MTMKRHYISLICAPVVLLIAFSSNTFSQTLNEKRFKVTIESEALLDLTAYAPNTSWIEKSSEAATATIFLDNRYCQDVILFAGSQSFTYRLMLGRVGAGEHLLRIEYNRKQSAPQTSTIKIEDVKIRLIDRRDPEFQAIASSPILYARPDSIGRFSDIPLLVYYETESHNRGVTIRYTVIFSNEDGGTQTSALMARWGRTTDIEWVTETQIDSRGEAIQTSFQGIEHETKIFQGKREAGHPLLIVASDNNNFADVGSSALRFALWPVAVDLSQSSREGVMDRHPWIYRIMAEEMIREQKITSIRTLGERIADLRNYLYLDATSRQQNGAALSFAVKLNGDPKWYSSDLGIGYYKIDRSGNFRTTVRLPQGTTIDRIERIAARCDLSNNPKSPEEIIKASAAQCELKSINKVFFLDEKFVPGPSLSIKIDSINLHFGEMIIFEGGHSVESKARVQ
jgi:hypothetical protein